MALLNEKDVINEIQRVIEIEKQSLETLISRVKSGNENLSYFTLTQNIIECIENGNKVVVAGLGKSGKIAQKISATFSSTGTPSVYLHATEALHGDLGVVQKGDVVILISNSGTTDVSVVVESLKKMKVIIACIVGDMNSYLARNSQIAINASVDIEACPNNLAPTSSTTVALAIGDALAMAVQKARNFKPEDYAIFHPGGALGRKLLQTVADVMHSGAELPVVNKDSKLQDVLIMVTEKKMGGALVVENNKLIGLITDGDIRRAILGEKEKIFHKLAYEIMTKNPVSITPNEKLTKALDLMENRPSQIAVLPVVDENGNAVGILRLHDLAKS